MRQACTLVCFIISLALCGVSGCGGGAGGKPNDTTAPPPAAITTPGTLAVSPPLRLVSLTATGFTTELSTHPGGAELISAIGNPACGVDFYELHFWTRGGANETTESSGAMMVPTGNGTNCPGSRPIVLYAHGTQRTKNANIANPTNRDNTEGDLIAAIFASQGYIVVAPNYAGYDISTLGYHPYLNATQQSGEMMDSLKAARTALSGSLNSTISDSGKLFVTGYSQGGYVALATVRALELAKSPITAAAPMSGPYALEAFADAVFFGSVNNGATVLLPLLTSSYQHAYGNIYAATSDIYNSLYATGIDTLLPSTTPISTLYATGKLPEHALFNDTTPVVTLADQPLLATQVTTALALPKNPDFAAGFGTNALITNAYRASYAIDAALNPDGAIGNGTPSPGSPIAAKAPSHPLRHALYLNDLRGGDWAPSTPLLLCGGRLDPSVFYSLNTGALLAHWNSQGVPMTLVASLDMGATPSGTFKSLQQEFQASQQALFAYYLSSGNNPEEAIKALQDTYHAALAPFCARAARTYFDRY